jgi:alpha-L-rhamnosidase
MMAEMASALGLGKESDHFAKMADSALAHIRSNFLKDDGSLAEFLPNFQTALLFAVKLGVFKTAETEANACALLLKNIADNGGCLQTGFLGTSILMDTLTYRVGRPDASYSLLLQHKNPSWLYSVDQGATTIWERWNSYRKDTGFGDAGMNSFNHYAYGAVLAWMYKTMAGIGENPMYAQGGFQKILLAPQPDRRVGSVDCSLDSEYGVIRSAWRYADDGAWHWEFTIPANATALVRIPGGKTQEYVAGTYKISLPAK